MLAYDAPQNPLVGWGRGHPSPFLSPRRLRRLASDPQFSSANSHTGSVSAGYTLIQFLFGICHLYSQRFIIHIMGARLTEWIWKLIPKTKWCMSKWAICDFQGGDGWQARKSDNRWGAGTAKRLKRDKVVKIARLNGCKNFVSERESVWPGGKMSSPSELEIKSRPPRADSDLARMLAVTCVALVPRRLTTTSSLPAFSQTQYSDWSSSTVDHSSVNLQIVKPWFIEQNRNDFYRASVAYNNADARYW